MNQENQTANTAQGPSNQIKPPEHKKFPVRAVAVAAVILVVCAVAAFLLLKDSSKSSDTKTSDSSGTSTEQPSSITRISVAEEGKLVLPNGHADPTVVPTPTGYRMYVNRQSGGPSGYLTFVSSDGINWTKENDIVIPGVSTGRAVVLPDGIRVYYPGPQPIKPGDPPADMLSSFSTDGVAFTKDAGVRLSPRDNAHYVEGPTVFQLPDKSWRMYFNENSIAAGNNRDGEIWGASSTDGLVWERDDKVTLTAGTEESQQTNNSPAPWRQVLHPFVIKNPKGGYIMFYNSHSEIYAATSSDGLAWQKIGRIGIHGADIDGYFQKDGTLRVYYGDFSEQTGGLVYTAVLKVE
jgi:hypothetical protein